MFSSTSVYHTLAQVHFIHLRVRYRIKLFSKLSCNLFSYVVSFYFLLRSRYSKTDATTHQYCWKYSSHLISQLLSNLLTLIQKLKNFFLLYDLSMSKKYYFSPHVRPTFLYKTYIELSLSRSQWWEESAILGILLLLYLGFYW